MNNLPFLESYSKQHLLPRTVWPKTARGFDFEKMKSRTHIGKITNFAKSRLAKSSSKKVLSASKSYQTLLRYATVWLDVISVVENQIWTISALTLGIHFEAVRTMSLNIASAAAKSNEAFVAVEILDVHLHPIRNWEETIFFYIERTSLTITSLLVRYTTCIFLTPVLYFITTVIIEVYPQYLTESVSLRDIGKPTSRAEMSSPSSLYLKAVKGTHLGSALTG